MSAPLCRSRGLFAASAVALLAIALPLGCSSSSESGTQRDAAAGGKTTGAAGAADVLCTVPMLSDLAEAVAGEHLTVETLLGRGVDPHIYRPTTADAIACQEAGAVLYVGLRLEGALAENLEQLGRSRPHVVAIGERLPEDRVLEADDGTGHVDPHIWMDVALWAETVPAIVETLSQLAPDHAADFAANGQALTEELQAFDVYVRERIATIPDARRVMITAHDAFQYFGRGYGIRVQGVQGVSTASEAGIRDIQRLVELLRETGVQTVFAESSTSDRQIAALVESAEAAGLEVGLSGPLFSDSTGPAGTWEGTYVGMIDHNVSLIVGKLGGEVPEGGWRSVTGELERAESGGGGAETTPADKTE